MSENGNNHAFISLVENFLARIRLLHRGGGGGGGFMYTLRDAQCLAYKKKKKKKTKDFFIFHRCLRNLKLYETETSQHLT